MGDQVSIPPIKIVIDSSSPTTNKNPSSPSPNQSSILTKFHAGYFSITLSLAAQALLWKTLTEHTDNSRALRRVSRTLPSTTFLLVWYLALTSQIALSLLYFLRCIFHTQMVRSEFSHYVGVNFLFAPSTTWLLLIESCPSTILSKSVSGQILWWVFVLPVLVLDVKIYGQWFTTEKRFLSVYANPTSQVSVIGNLVGAWVAAETGWREVAVCVFTLGAAHYLVVFVTLYQRLSGGCGVPGRQRPVLFLFVAAPSVGSLAWRSICGTFNVACRMLFSLSLFLFVSLVCRPALFKKSLKRFNIAWWAYSFPVSFLALASAEYAKQVPGVVPAALMLALSSLSILVFLCLMVFTALNTDLLLHENDAFFYQ